MKTSLSSRRIFLALGFGFVAVVSLLSPPRFFAQGPLTPPGAPAPTMKTLDQIEPRTPIPSLPFTISTSGSYYVTASLTAPANSTGITINASNVTLDLGGFELIGSSGSTGTYGIRMSVGRSNVVIRNGTVRNWQGIGVTIENTGDFGLHLEHLRVVDNVQLGISLGSKGVIADCIVNGSAGTNIVGNSGCKVLRTTASGSTNVGGMFFGTETLLEDCQVIGNATQGITVGDHSIVTRCVATGNGVHGIKVGNACVLTGCVASGNTSDGFIFFSRTVVHECAAENNGLIGFSGSSGATLSGCTAAGNTSHGFVLTDAASLRGCSAFSNTGTGISVATGASIIDCVAQSNNGAAGISTGFACTIIGCALRANSSSQATSAGIITGTESLISQCVVSNTASIAAALTSTTGMGISAGAGSTVERCTVQGSRGDGIRVTSQCVVIGNTCDANGTTTGDGAGVHSTGAQNRIEGNSVTNNDRGIDVDSTGSLIIKNSASGNTTDYVIAASNRYGPIVDISATGTAAVSGSSAAGTLASTDPWANFSY